MENMSIRPATGQDLFLIEKLLSNQSLPVDDIKENGIQFFLAEIDGQVVATIGLESYQEDGLLRSLAVADQFKSKGIGKEMISHLLAFSSDQNIRDIYLLTTTVPDYFKKIGFQVAEKQDAPETIRQTREFSSICPDSAIFMKYHL